MELILTKIVKTTVKKMKILKSNFSNRKKQFSDETAHKLTGMFAQELSSCMQKFAVLG